MKKQAIQPTVETELLTVEYWRKRFSAAYTRFGGLTELHKILGEQEDDFAGVPGYRRLESIKRGKASLTPTAKAVQLMEQLRPASSAKASVLSRQNLKVD